LNTPKKRISARELACGISESTSNKPIKTEEPGLNPLSDFGEAILPLDARLRLESQLEQMEEDAESTIDPIDRADLSENIDKLKHTLKTSRFGSSNVRFSDRSTRDRVCVTTAIKRAVRRIAEQNSALGTHLHNSIHTGLQCYYSPDRPIEWQT
jgi:hypothetical protein